ncbi:MAG: hypothetical protein JNM24_03115 [Bdellovibrionaceae bacterium]|nr:hypothetical protein [Pseudobdellovibrionaceae bacterium]
MTFIDWFVKFIFLSWLIIFGVAFTDAALDLQDKTIKAYQKGSISAHTFTQMLTTEDFKRSKK